MIEETFEKLEEIPMQTSGEIFVNKEWYNIVNMTPPPVLQSSICLSNLPKTGGGMKAIIFERHGGPEVLQYRDVQKPKISGDEILVEVKACALNHLDIWTRNGLPGIKIPLPHVLGCESAGVVREAGKKVKNVTVGDDVLIAPGISCGRCEFCKENRDSLCSEFNIMGFRCDGGYAEFVKAPARNAVKISTKNLSYAEWAAVPLCFVTAWHMLFTRANLQKGEKVLIHSAGSGVGSAAIQLARWKKAFVITTAGSDEKLKRGKKLGAQEAINYTQKDVAQEVKRITDGKGVDVVLEHIGPQTWAQSLASLGRGGRLVTCGATSGPQVTLDLRFCFSRELSISGCYMGSRKELDQVIKWVKSEKVKPIVDTVFPLVAAARAQTRMESRQFFGKLVLEP